jgi:hypothetical protein
LWWSWRRALRARAAEDAARRVAPHPGAPAPWWLPQSRLGGAGPAPFGAVWQFALAGQEQTATVKQTGPLADLPGSAPPHAPGWGGAPRGSPRGARAPRSPRAVRSEAALRQAGGLR